MAPHLRRHPRPRTNFASSLEPTSRRRCLREPPLRRGPQETRGARRSSKPMATRKKRAAPARPRRPRSPARVRKRKKQARGHQHPELWGLGLVAVGRFLATVVWLGWDGGPVGSHVSGWAARRPRLGRAARPARAAGDRRADARAERARRPQTVPHRSRRRAGSWADDRPGRRSRGRHRSRARGRPRASARRSRVADRGCRAAARGRAARDRCVCGALLRRSGHVVRQAGTAARRSIESIEWADWSDSASSADGPEPDVRPAVRGVAAPVDGMQAFPDVVAPGPQSAEPPPLLPPEQDDESTAEDAALVFHAPASGAEYRLPERTLLSAPALRLGRTRPT